MQKKITAIVIAALLLLPALAGCGSGPAEETQPPQTTAADTAPADETESPDPELADPNRDWEPIDTKYGRLRYPDDLFGFLQTTQTEDGDVLNVLFYSVIGDLRFDLFEISIGAPAADAEVKITGPDQTQRGVNARIIPIGENTGLRETELNRLYAMQEALNFVLDHVS